MEPQVVSFGSHNNKPRRPGLGTRASQSTATKGQSGWRRNHTPMSDSKCRSPSSLPHGGCIYRATSRGWKMFRKKVIFLLNTYRFLSLSSSLPLPFFSPSLSFSLCIYYYHYITITTIIILDSLAMQSQLAWNLLRSLGQIDNLQQSS